MESTRTLIAGSISQGPSIDRLPVCKILCVLVCISVCLYFSGESPKISSDPQRETNGQKWLRGAGSFTVPFLGLLFCTRKPLTEH